jgi:hypothetical protein
MARCQYRHIKHMQIKVGNLSWYICCKNAPTLSYGFRHNPDLPKVKKHISVARSHMLYSKSNITDSNKQHDTIFRKKKKANLSCEVERCSADQEILYSQIPTNGPYLSYLEHSPHLHTNFSKIQLKKSSHPTLFSFPRDFPINTLYAYLTSPMCYMTTQYVLIKVSL